MLRNPAKLFGPQPLAAVTTVFAVGIIMPSMISTGGQANGQASGARSASHARTASGPVWAVTATGRKVLVPKPKFAPTPIRPEKITHPKADTMGAVTAAHAPWRRSARITNAAATAAAAAVPQLPGIDVSAYQGYLPWKSLAHHIDFSYAKATEGTYYTNPYFYNQYVGPYNRRIIRGAYHFAIPNNSSGQSQADYFIKHGGGWSGDGRTLPGALDIEYNPYGSECYGLTHRQMNTWLENFVKEYAYKEHVYPVIYTTTDWWRTCTGDATRFHRWDPLWIANYSASGGGPLPRGWGFYTFWQYASGGSLPGDQDVFNGALSRLSALAKGG